MKEQLATLYAFLESEKFRRFKSSTERFLKIRSEDWPILSVLFFLFLSLNVALWGADMPTKALFYSIVGKAQVPPMLFLNAILGAAAAIAISAFVDKLNKAQLFMWTTAGLAVVAIASRIIIGQSPPPWILYFLFVLTNAFRGLLIMLFWLVATEICDTRRAKRIFGIVTSGGTIGSIVCFFVISRLAKPIGTENIYILWIIALIASALISYSIVRKRKRVGFFLTDEALLKLKDEGVPGDALNKLEGLKNKAYTTKEKFTEALEKTLDAEKLREKAGKSEQTIRRHVLNNVRKAGGGAVRRTITLRNAVQNVVEGIHIVWSEISLAKVLFFAMIFYFTLSYTTDVAFESALSDQHGQDQMTSLMSLFKGIAFFGALFAQLVLSNKIIQSVGVHNSMLSSPILYAIGFAALFLGTEVFGSQEGEFVYVSVILMAISRDVVFFSIYNPGYQSMYNSISEEKRGRASAVVNGIGVPIAGGLAAIITGALTRPGWEDYYGLIMIAPLLLSVGFLYVGRRVGKTYLQALMIDLQKDEVGTFDEILPEQIETKTISKAEMDALIQSLTEKDVKGAIRSAQLIAVQGNPKTAVELLNVLPNVASEEVRVKLIETLGQIGDESCVPALLEFLNGGHSKEINIAAIQALSQLRDERAKGEVKPILNNENQDPDVRAASGALLVNLGDDSGVPLLEEMLSSPDFEKRLPALKAVSLIPAPALYNDVIKVSKATIAASRTVAPNIRRHAARALTWVDKSEAINPLIQAMGDPDPIVKDAAETALANHGEKVIEPLFKVIRSGYATEDFQRRAVKVLGKLEGDIGEKALLDVLFSEDGGLRTAVLESLARRGELKNKERLENYILEEISKIYENLLFITLLERYRDTTAGEMLRIFMLEENRRKKDHILQAVGLIVQDPETLDLIARKLRSPDTFIRANALEMLENQGHKDLMRHVLPIMESPDNEQTLTRFRDVQAGLGANIQQVIIGLLKSSNPIIRASTVYLIGEIREKNWIKIMHQLCGMDPVDLVRKNVGEAVNRIVFPEQANQSEQSMSELEKIFFLKKVPLFQNMRGEDVHRIARICLERRFPSGNTIITESEPVKNPKLYVISSDMPLQMSRKSEQGPILKFLKKGQYFGDIEVFSAEENPPASSTVETMMDSRLLEIDGKRMKQEMRRNPAMAIEICREFSNNVRGAIRLVVNDYYDRLETWGIE